MAKHLVLVAGNIGSGKTTLTKLLSNHYDWEPHYEAMDNNPYITDFYDDMTRWSFNLQIYFLNSRIQQLIKIQEGKDTVIQDRTIYEDAFIFAPNLHSMGLMTTRDFENYFSIFNLMDSFVSAPDLLIYLRASVPTLVNQIQKRGREYESGIRLDYLSKLNERAERFEEMINSIKNIISTDPHLSQEERELFSSGYKNLILPKRSSWRILYQMEKKELIYEVH